MIAALLHGREDLRVEEVADPEPGPDEVKIAIAYNGLCGTDLHEYFDGPLACTHEPHPLTGGALPQVMGHEFAGTVAAVGSDVDNVALGDRVTVEPLYYCRRCHACRAGLTQLCELVMTHGICSNGGGLAEYTVVPSWMLHRLPESMTLAQGALVEPLSVSFSGAVRAGLEPGDSALVLGAGPIGIGVTLALLALGVDDIVVVEPARARRAAVEALGLEHVIDPGAVDVADEIRRRTDGRGVDAAIDCAGAAATFSVAPAVLRPRGRYVILAFNFIDVPFAPWLLARAEIELTGSCGYNSAVFERVIELIDGGAYPTDAWVEHVGLDDVTRVLTELRAGERMKVLVDLAGGADA